MVSIKEGEEELERLAQILEQEDLDQEEINSREFDMAEVKRKKYDMGKPQKSTQRLSILRYQEQACQGFQTDRLLHDI